MLRLSLSYDFCAIYFEYKQQSSVFFSSKLQDHKDC